MTDEPGTTTPTVTDEPGTTTPPVTDEPGTTAPPVTDEPGTTAPPVTDEPGTTTPPVTDEPGTTTPPVTDGLDKAAEQIDWLNHLDSLYAAAAISCSMRSRRSPPSLCLLNYLGVLLFELGELEPAIPCFEAALRLDPDLPHAMEDLDQARRRKQGAAATVVARHRSQLLALGVRARRLAGTAQHARRLTISLCMIVKDEEEMLLGCLEAVRRPSTRS